MNLVELDRYLVRGDRARRGPVSSLVGRIARLIGADPLSRAEKRLRRMTDEQLADIGVTRWQIPEAVRFGRNALSQGGAEIIPLPSRTRHASGGPDWPRAA
jgi:uncharacterized protein YjiS (DUF1127 family)